MKVKYAPICCYFGKFSNYFPLVLKSCSYNKGIDFHIVTDNDMSSYELPENVRVINMSFAELQDLVKVKFPGVDICLDRPYKVCDFKVAYGYLFQEYIKSYDYWGIFDVDLIFGDIEKFLPDNGDNRYVKMLPCGHLMFVKNAEPYNQMFRRSNDFDDLPQWEKVFSSPESFYFDEHGGFDQIFFRLEKDRYFNKCQFDNVMPPWKYDHFVPINFPEKKFVVYSFEKGRVYRLSLDRGEVKKEELIYVHFSKRNVSVECENEDEWLLVPNSFINYKELCLFELLWLGRPRYLSVILRKLKNRI